MIWQQPGDCCDFVNYFQLITMISSTLDADIAHNQSSNW